MNKVILYFAVMATGFCMQIASAQTQTDSLKIQTKGKTDNSDEAYKKQLKERLLADLKAAKEDVSDDEKAKLKRLIELYNKQLEDGKITAEEAQQKKEKAAKDAALNIDNKTAILENQIQLAERDQKYDIQAHRGAYIALGLGNAYDDTGSALLGFEYKNETAKPKFDKRTSGDVVIAFGVSNVVSEGESFKDSPFGWWKSTYAELGYTMRTRLLKDSNFWRVAYGLSFQLTNLSASGNRYFADEAGQTTLQPFPYKLKKHEFTITNLVVPVYLEFGPSKRNDFPDKFRYNTLDSFKFGIGGYAGMRTNVMQQFEYNANNSKNIDRHYQDYNVSNFVYGVGAYVGCGPVALYLKYDLNPIFKNAAVNQHAISLAIRLDL